MQQKKRIVVTHCFFIVILVASKIEASWNAFRQIFKPTFAVLIMRRKNRINVTDY
jgi:hypothetical protein